MIEARVQITSANAEKLVSLSVAGATSVVSSIGSEVLMLPVTGQGLPGVWTSPADAGTLSARARIPAVQIAFRVFMNCSPNFSFVGLANAVDHEDGSPTAGSLTRRIITASQTSCKISCMALKGSDLT